MKKKMVVKIVLVILLILILFIGGWYFMFCHLGIGPAFPFLSVREMDVKLEPMDNLAENQLMSLTPTQEEAEAIAQQYGIELVSFSDGVASYRTEEDPKEVIARGEENGYPQLYLNYIRTIQAD